MRHIGFTLAFLCCLFQSHVVSAPVEDPPRGKGEESGPKVLSGIPYAEYDPTLKANIYIPSGQGPFPGVLAVHGGAWRMGSPWHMHRHALQLAKAGYTVVAISYRLAPTHKFPAQLQDCATAVCFMRRNAQKYKIDPENIGGYGYSAGGHLVSLLGACQDAKAFDFLDTEQCGGQMRLQSVVAGGAPCDFRSIDAQSKALSYWLGDTRKRIPDIYQRASPIHFASQDDPPMFFFHGQNDQLVPSESPREMCKRLHHFGLRADLLIIPETGHIGAHMRPVPTAAISFFDETLKGPVTASPKKDSR